MMAGVNSVSTYDDNEPDSLSDSPERTNKADDDSDDKDSGDDGSLQGDIDTELSRRLHQSETLLAAESVHGATLDAAEDGHFADLEQLSNSNSGYQMQRDSTELLLLSEKHHAGETGSDRGSGSEAAAPVDKSDLDNDGPLSDNTSSGFEDGPTGGLVAVDGSDADRPCTEPSLEQPPRVFTRPVPADETDNVTELVFDTWTTVDEPTTQLHDQKDPADLQQESAELLDISAAAASDNQECFEINAPAITNSVVKKTYCDEANRKSSTVIPEEPVPASVPIDELKRNFVGAIDRQPSESALTNGCSKSSFGKFDQLEKKAILQQRSLDSDKSDVKQNGVARPEVNSVCKSCDKTVYAMEQIKAERQVWHKNCFRCTTCNKQLTLDIYSSHEGLLYCKPHFKELFQPKAVVEEDEPIKRKKPELIIRENQPTELPPDVVRASDKPDLGLEELSSLNVKSRYQAFENASVNGNGPVEKSPVSVKRSPSILSKMAKFKSKGMDVGVPNEALNGAFFEPSSSSDGENDEDDDGGEVTKNCISKEKPMSFDKMESVKRNWEMRREEMKEEHKQEIQNIRSKLFLGKQGKMKQMYEQAVAESERTGVKRDVNINKSEKAKVIKEKFERGETLNDDNENGEPDEANKTTNQDEDEMSVFEAGISKKSRSHFMELDANAAKTLQSPPISVAKKEFTPSKPITPMYNRQVSEDVVKSSDRIEDVTVETADVCSKFKFFETYKPPPAPKRQFRITPPREGQTKGESPERDIYRDPNVVRSEDPVDETAELVKSNTTSKMLSLFRQMEVAKQDVPEGPKPMKRFTPPPDYKESSGTESESDDEVSDSEEEESTGSEANGDVVKSSMKVEDEFLKNAQNAVKAKSLKEKFEHWEPEKHSINNAVTMLDSEQESIESTKSLLARFESLKAERPAEKPKPKVNRFVQQSESIVLCESCEKKVYPLEKVEIEGRPFHRTCFKCTQCQCVLRMDTFTWNNNKLYCLPHFKRLFISKGNYDEGFGGNQHKKKWETNGHHAPQPQVVDRPSN
ncbi:F-actin-monooxygenase MICAL3 isoform X6 [Adelges cooleyi]|uniref:F-actin-monooxygenase MICAL3 isoform X6 n=1 Tax=Adelges cooleyi TaxID=133065 RepID=UPI00217FBEBC|nr:F-actin-monooxygenase MICAL3 isoform X6 [Adelges cooleyi]